MAKMSERDELSDVSSQESDESSTPKAARSRSSSVSSTETVVERSKQADRRIVKRYSEEIWFSESDLELPDNYLTEVGLSPSSEAPYSSLSPASSVASIAASSVASPPSPTSSSSGEGIDLAPGDDESGIDDLEDDEPVAPPPTIRPGSIMDILGAIKRKAKGKYFGPPLGRIQSKYSAPLLVCF